MAKIAVISALERELYPLLRRFEAGNGGGFIKTGDFSYKCAVPNHEIYGAYSGIGKVNAAYRTAEIIMDFSPELVVNIGYAGGMREDSRHGDIVIGDGYVQADFDAVLDGAKPGEVPGARPHIIPKGFLSALEKQCELNGYRYFTGKIATGDFFLTDSIRKAEIVKAFSPCAFDMESAAIAHVCAQKGLPFTAVRVLSDLADDEAQVSFTGLSDPIETRPVNILLGAIVEWRGI